MNKQHRVTRFRFEFSQEGVRIRAQSQSPRGSYFDSGGGAVILGLKGTKERRAAIAAGVDHILGKSV